MIPRMPGKQLLKRTLYRWLRMRKSKVAIAVSLMQFVMCVYLVTTGSDPSLQKDWTPGIFDKGNTELTRSLRARRLTTSLPPIRHIGFLKVHKAGSSTMQNIFYRFGLRRSLSFVLRNDTHNVLSLYKDRFGPILPPFRVNPESQNEQGKYDILCNHVMFNYDVISGLLHEDAVYIAIIRDPLSLFLSSAYYFKYVWNFHYLTLLSNDTFVTDLIREPKKYEAISMANSMTFNPMAYDFGFDFRNVTYAEKITPETFEHFLKTTGDTFKVVLIVERFDESLVLMKRYLNWELSDIIYLPNNVLADQLKGKIRPNITEEDKTKFRHRNRFDYSIYEYFTARFEKQFETEVNIKEETKHFKDILQLTRDYCLNGRDNAQHEYSSGVNIEASIWNEKFTVTANDCELMLKPELSFDAMLKSRHRELLEYFGTDVLH